MIKLTKKDKEKLSDSQRAAIQKLDDCDKEIRNQISYVKKVLSSGGFSNDTEKGLKKNNSRLLLQN